MPFSVTIFAAVSILIAASDIIVALWALQKGTRSGYYLLMTGITAAVVDLSYMVSIFTQDYFITSLTCSIYFICIDIMLIFLCAFTIDFVGIHVTRRRKIRLRLIVAACFADSCILAVNPFKEISIGYIPQDTSIAHFAFSFYPPYYFHLALTYGLLVFVVFLLIRKATSVPHEYKMQYWIILIGIFFAVTINALFLFTSLSHIDYSLCCYSAALYVMYFSRFKYREQDMLKNMKNSIFESIDQALVLFDYDGFLLLNNRKSEIMMPDVVFCTELKIGSFMEACHCTSAVSLSDGDNFSFQCYIPCEDGHRPLRCDYKTMKNSRGQTLGRLFVFSDVTMETDILTGFHQWESFREFVSENPESFSSVSAAAVLDINNLSGINASSGHGEGDRKILLLAENLRKVLPRDTYFIRGNDANLIALCRNITEASVHNRLDSMPQIPGVTFQYAVCPAGVYSIPEAVDKALVAVSVRKLMDAASNRSGILTSLIKALEECDSDTEAHVRRTRNMGAELGRRIGLSDPEQSNLALLCVMHDIGKIGVPLDILNKPGRLTDSEWKIMRTHVEKGYQIVSSSPELSVVAGMVLHHHERWDGNGYPSGLAGENIPLLSRIISVVDSYDAMVCNRPYRSAVSHEEACEELLRCAGTQFDPSIAAEFVSMVRENPGKYMAEESIAVVKPDNTEVFPDSSVSSSQTVHAMKFSRYTLGPGNVILSVDDAFERITGYSREDLASIKLTQADLIPAEDRIPYFCAVNEANAKNNIVCFEHRIVRRDGSIIYVICHGRAYFDSARREYCSEITISDVSETYVMKVLSSGEKSARAPVSSLERDALTGLLTAAAFNAGIRERMREGGCRTVMLIGELDNFSALCEKQGRAAGDERLRLISGALQRALRSSDLACRTEGGIFSAALFFDGEPGDELMLSRAREIFDRLSMILLSAGSDTGISMGTAISAGSDSDINVLYSEAYEALTFSRTHGKARFTVYTPGLT